MPNFTPFPPIVKGWCGGPETENFAQF